MILLIIVRQSEVSQSVGKQAVIKLRRLRVTGSTSAVRLPKPDKTPVTRRHAATAAAAFYLAKSR